VQQGFDKGGSSRWVVRRMSRSMALAACWAVRCTGSAYASHCC
jgi:hypothetical protein